MGPGPAETRLGVRRRVVLIMFAAAVLTPATGEQVISGKRPNRTDLYLNDVVNEVIAQFILVSTGNISNLVVRCCYGLHDSCDGFSTTCEGYSTTTKNDTHMVIEFYLIKDRVQNNTVISLTVRNSTLELEEVAERQVFVVIKAVQSACTGSTTEQESEVTTQASELTTPEPMQDTSTASTHHTNTATRTCYSGCSLILTALLLCSLLTFCM